MNRIIQILLGFVLIPSMALAYPQLVNLSAYTTYENGTITASGKTPREGMIACDHLPFGTVVVIDGREYVVEDRFGGGYTDRIDIFMTHYDDAIEHGRRYVVVEIREE